MDTCTNRIDIITSHNSKDLVKKVNDYLDSFTTTAPPRVDVQVAATVNGGIHYTAIVYYEE